MRVLVTNLAGAYRSPTTLQPSRRGAAAGGPRAERVRRGPGRGNLLFTVAPLFKAFVLSPDGSVQSFADGSAPGLFNITKGIARTNRANIYVVDSLNAR